MISLVCTHPRELFDTVFDEEGGGSHPDDSVELPPTLLHIGRAWITAGDLDQAEWFIAHARQMHASWTSKCNNDSTRTGVLCDILLSSLELAIAKNYKVSG